MTLEELEAFVLNHANARAGIHGVNGIISGAGGVMALGDGAALRWPATDTAVGNYAHTTGTGGLGERCAFGYGAGAETNWCSAFGAFSLAKGVSSLAVGHAAQATVTGSHCLGADGSVTAGGLGVGGSVLVDVAQAAVVGNNAQGRATGATVLGNGAIVAAGHTNGIAIGNGAATEAASDGQWGASGSPVDFKMYGTSMMLASTTFIYYGGKTSSFPALKRNSAALQCQLADNSGPAQFVCLDVLGFNSSAAETIRIAGSTGFILLSEAGHIKWSGDVNSNTAAAVVGLLGSSTDGILRLTNGSTGGGGFEFVEHADFAAGAADTARLYARDNGSGKTQLCVIFSSGAVQVIATQP